MEKTGREGKHLWNGCGSEAGKSERKRTAKLSTETGEERTGNQAGENGESRGSKSESGALRKPLRGGVREKGKEAQRLSSQNRKRSERKRADRKGKGRQEGDARNREKASTRGTAVGANQGRAKGNEQEAE